MGTPLPEARGKTYLRVAAAELRCAVSTIGLLVRHRLLLASSSSGMTVTFGDGSVSRVYRETVLRGRPDDPNVVLVVGFRLRGIGTNRIWHALFRFESLFNTLLFAAHEGFHTKLWLTDLDTGYYRGIYEWRDPRSAVDYLETLRVVLRPWVEKGSFAYQILEISRDDYLAGLLTSEQDVPAASLWWVPVRASRASVG